MADEPQETEGSALRKQLEAALADNKALKSERRERAFSDAGYDPSAGNGKALAKLYDGEATVEAIQAFAKDEFGWEPPAEESAEDTKSEENGWDQLSRTPGGQSPTPNDPSSLDNRIAKAQADGNWDEFDLLSAEKVEAARR